jgi:hypothetical protein
LHFSVAFVHFQQAIELILCLHACELEPVFAALGQCASEIHAGAANKILPTARTSELTIGMGFCHIKYHSLQYMEIKIFLSTSPLMRQLHQGSLFDAID